MRAEVIAHPRQKHIARDDVFHAVVHKAAHFTGVLRTDHADLSPTILLFDLPLPEVVQAPLQSEAPRQLSAVKAVLELDEQVEQIRRTCPSQFLEAAHFSRKEVPRDDRLRPDIEGRRFHSEEFTAGNLVAAAAPKFPRRQAPHFRTVPGRRRELKVDADDFLRSIERWHG